MCSRQNSKSRIVSRTHFIRDIMQRGPVIAKEAYGKQIPMCFWSARLVRR